MKVPKSAILFKIKVALQVAMRNEITLRKAGDTLNDRFDEIVSQKTVSRAIISMFPQIGVKPDDATDDDVIKLLKKYINQEKERNLYQLRFLKESDVEGKSTSEIKKLVKNKIQELDNKLISPQIEIAQSYLPKQVSEEDIILWIKENIDFSKYKNKMQAMGPIMKNFTGCDGNFVKNILLNYNENK